MTGLALGGAVGSIALIAAAAFFCKRSQRAQRGGRLKTDLELPLLASDRSGGGNPLASAPASQPASVATAPPVASADSSDASAGSAATDALRASLSSEAEYDEATSIPANAAAKKLVVLEWSTGKVSSVINLPFSLLRQATLDFADLQRLGVGASCVVFKGLVFGETVAIKVVLP